MPKSLKQEIIYGIMMVFAMVYAMVCYNVTLNVGCLLYTSDGRIRCVHETSGSINNVTVGTRNAGWPYYRRLID